MECIVCGQEILNDTENCYQIRYGHMEEDDEFYPEEDFGYVHTHCFPMEG